MGSRDIVILEGSQIKAFPSSRHPISSDSTIAILEIMEVVVTLLASYQKVHQVIQLGFSSVLLLLKIMGEFGVLVGCLCCQNLEHGYRRAKQIMLKVVLMSYVHTSFFTNSELKPLFCSPRSSKLSISPHGSLSGSSPPVGSMPKPFPPFQHPSHQLLEENGFRQQK